MNKIASERVKSINERPSKNVLKTRQDLHLIDIIRPISIKSYYISGEKHELFYEVRLSIENGVFLFFFTKIVYFEEISSSQVGFVQIQSRRDSILEFIDKAMAAVIPLLIWNLFA